LSEKLTLQNLHVLLLLIIYFGSFVLQGKWQFFTSFQELASFLTESNHISWFESAELMLILEDFIERGGRFPSHYKGVMTPFVIHKIIIIMLPCLSMWILNIAYQNVPKRHSLPVNVNCKQLQISHWTLLWWQFPHQHHNIY